MSTPPVDRDPSRDWKLHPGPPVRVEETAQESLTRADRRTTINLIIVVYLMAVVIFGGVGVIVGHTFWAQVVVTTVPGPTVRVPETPRSCVLALDASDAISGLSAKVIGYQTDMLHALQDADTGAYNRAREAGQGLLGDVQEQTDIYVRQAALCRNGS
jgi:hypothetical protein